MTFRSLEATRPSLPHLGPGTGKRETGHSRQNDEEPKQCHDPLDATAKSESFLLKDVGVHFEEVYSDDFGASGCEPAASGGARNTSPFRVPDVTR